MAAFKIYADTDSIIIESEIDFTSDLQNPDYMQFAKGDIRYTVIATDKLRITDKFNANYTWIVDLSSDEIQNSSGTDQGNLAAVKTYLNGIL